MQEVLEISSSYVKFIKYEWNCIENSEAHNIQVASMPWKRKNSVRFIS